MESRSVSGHPKRDQHLFLNDFNMSITFAAFDYKWVCTQFNTKYMTGLWAQLINPPFPQRIGGGGGSIHINISFLLITKVSDKFRLIVRVDCVTRVASVIYASISFCFIEIFLQTRCHTRPSRLLNCWQCRLNCQTTHPITYNFHHSYLLATEVIDR